MIRFLFSAVEILFKASQDMPPVSAPSPTTTTTCRSFSPCRAKPRDIPSPHESAVDACEFSMTSCTLSLRFG